MLPTARPVRHTPPAAAIVAAVLGLVACVIPGLFLLITIALSEPNSLEQPAWIDVALPLALVCGLVTGVVLLLLGRSWLVLAASSGVLVGLMVVAHALGWSGGPFFFPGWFPPVLSVVLSALPGVRGWVAARRAERTR